jgi:ligand-binding SRPBCC domain-containing protein
LRLERLHCVLRLPVGLSVAWDFFSDPRNLGRMTPPSLAIEITSEPPPRMVPGMIITYTIRPLLGIPVRWVTEITHVREPNLFVDEQRFGPYRFWHHQHHFREVDGGIEMEDLVHYSLPFGGIGRVLGGSYVRRQLAGVFSFRRTFLEKTFGTMPETGCGEKG